MTYQDPDPLRDRDLNPRMQSDMRRDTGFNAMWGWIAGAVVLVLLLVFMFGGTQNTATTDINNSPAAPTITTPPANDNAAAPRSMPSETTGQSQQR